ncbi:MAG: hypothetical protein WCI36_05315 [bacterium]
MEKQLSDLMGADLNGYRLMNAYWMEPVHGLSGAFPALNQTIAGNPPVVTLNEELLKKVVEMLPAKDCGIKIHCLLALVDLYNNELVFLQENAYRISPGRKFINILTENDLFKIKASGENPFAWAI